MCPAHIHAGMKWVLLSLFAFVVTTPGSQGSDLHELKASDGRIVQIAADFSIEDFQIIQDGKATFKATAVIGGDAVAISITIDKFQVETVGDAKRGQKEMPIYRAGLDIRSVGAPTERLERILNARLSKLDAKQIRITGPYDASSQVLVASPLSSPILISADSINITYNQSGEAVLGACFNLELLMDAPLRRLTIYFAESGYSGIQYPTRARTEWLDTLKHKAHQ